MAMPDAKRRYDSSSRRAQMTAGRRRILASARHLFAARAYAAVSIEDVAAGADVAVPTVYAAFGSKRGLMLALLDGLEPATGESSAGEPEEQLRGAIDAAVETFQRDADLIEACRTSGDGSLIRAWTEYAERRRAGAAQLVRRWAEAGALAPRLTIDEAIDVYDALAGPQTFRRLVNERGWTPARYAQWLYELLRWELFGRYRGLRRPT